MQTRRLELKTGRSQGLEQLRDSLFPPAGENLNRMIELHRQRREQRRYVKTYVTYGAYEKPI